MQRFSWFHLRGMVVIPASLVLAACAWTSAAAQQDPEYTQVPPLWDKTKPEDVRPFRERERLVRDILNGRAELAGQAKDDFQQYIIRQVFAEMTLLSDLGNLANKRREFFRSHFELANPPKATHDFLVGITLNTMKAISISPRFHPAVRCNAMLIIGELNEVESAGFGRDRRPPTPLPDALEFMLTQIRNPKQIDQVRAAALVGVLRHAELHRILGKTVGLSLSQDQQKAWIQTILAAVLPLAQQKDPPAGRSLEGHTWMRRRAIDVFVALNANSGPPLALLDQIVANADAPFSLRITAAKALGRLEYGDTGQDYDGAEAAQHLASLAADVCQAELAWWEAEIKREEEAKLRSGPGGMMSGGMSGMPGEYGAAMPGAESYTDPAMYGEYGSGMYGDPAAKKEPEKKKVEYRVEKTQRRLKYVLAALKTGLDGNPEFVAKGKTPDPPPEEGGILVRSSDEDKTRVKQVADAVTAMFLTVDTAEPERETMLAELETHLATMQALAGDPAAGVGPGSGPSGPPGSAPPGSGPPGSAPSGPPGPGPAPGEAPASLPGGA